MTDSEGKEICREARNLADCRREGRVEPGSAGRTGELETHLSSCPSCARWQKESADLLAMANAMPQFDVSEGLTQRIISAVEQERASRLSVLLLVSTGLIAGAALCFLLIDSLESVGGMMSWLIGLSGVIALRFLIGGADAGSKTGQLRHS